MEQKILSMAPAAQRWLEQSQFAFVLHVFDPVCNLINEEGEVFSLVGPFVGNGPFSGLTERGQFSTWISAESNVEISANNLQIDDTAISFKEARIWDPRPNWATLKNSSKQLLGASNVIEGLLREHAEAESFAQIVLPLSDANNPLSATHKKALEPIEKLLAAILAENSEVMRNEATVLGGLGAGLTPAGDDFLVGLMHALWATRPEAQALALSLPLADAAVPRTNSLSAAWLQAASQGGAGEPWHELIQAIDANNAEAIESAVMRILPTGHSSGADALGAFAILIRKILSHENLK